MSSYALVFFLTMTILLAALMFRIGLKHHAQKTIWAIADLAWISIGLLAFAYAILSIEESQKKIFAYGVNSTSELLKAEIRLASYDIGDKLCRPPKASSATPSSAICDVLPKIERQLLVPRFSHISAANIRKFKDTACATTSCGKEVIALSIATDAFESHYLENREILEEGPFRAERSKTNYAFLYIVG